jgi:hypothetical protein
MLTLLLACAPDPAAFEQDLAVEGREAAAMLPPIRSWFLDSDRDGYGQPGTAILSRTRPPGHVDNAADCDDDDELTYPTAAYKELRTACRTDADGDGFGSMAPESGVTPGLDCDDEDDTVSCVPEFGVGYAAEFEDASTHSPDYLLGTAFHVPPPGMTVTTLALIGKAAVANVKMAIYSGDTAGAPAQLMVATDPMPVPDGVLEIPVRATRLPAGTYWIMGVYDQEASIGIDYPPADNRIVMYRALDFSDPMPSTFGTPETYTGQRFNYYLLAY